MQRSQASSPIRAPPLRPARSQEQDLTIRTDVTKTSSSSTKPRYLHDLRRLSIHDSPRVYSSNTLDSPKSGKLQKSLGNMSATSGRVSRKKSLRNVVRRIFGHIDSIGEPYSSDFSASPLENKDYSHLEAFVNTPPSTQPEPQTLSGTSNIGRPLLSPPLPLLNTQYHPFFRLPSFRDSRDLLGRRNSLPTNRKPVSRDFSCSNSNSPISTNDPPNDSEIGMAITSVATTLRRRSRSVGDLTAIASKLYTYRRLEDEKNYWRQSYGRSAMLRPKSDDTELAVPRSTIEDLVSEGDTHQRQSFMAGDDGEIDRLDEQQHRLMTAHDSPVMGSRQPDADDDSSLQYRIVKLEQMMSAFQQPLESLAKSAKRKSVTFETTDSRRSSCQPMPDDSRLVFFINLINDERAKRRSLEKQVSALREDLAEMRFQLSQPIMSRHSRIYMSNPLRHRFGGSHSHSREPSNNSTYEPNGHQRLASRFSQSESLTESEALRMHNLDHTGEAMSESSTPFDPFHDTDSIRNWKHGSAELEMF